MEQTEIIHVIADNVTFINNITRSTSQNASLFHDTSNANYSSALVAAVTNSSSTNIDIANIEGFLDNNRPGYGWTASEEGISFYFYLFLSLLALNLLLCKLLHNRPRIAAIVPEAGVSIILGTLASFIIRLFVTKPTEVSTSDDDVVVNIEAANQVLTFSSTIFFVALLPPIIFNSGYQIKMELFLEDFTPIVSFACAGTFASTIVVSIILQIMVSAGLTDFDPSFTEILTFAASISSTDPVSTLNVFQTRKVDPRVFYLVFGESVLNDAVGLVLFNALSKFVGHENSFVKVTVAILAFVIDFLIVSVGSLCLGIFTGFLSGLVLKTVDMRNSKILELSLYMLVMYLPFFVAEILHLSGIVTILFCGISAKRYAEPNLSKTTKKQADALFQVLAYMAETAVFLELGLSIFGLQSRGNFHFKFIACAIFAILIGRFFNIYPIAFVYNRLMDRKFESSKRLSNVRRLGEYHRDDDDNESVISNNGGGIVSTSRSNKSETLGPHDNKISLNTCHMLWFSGLRGAVAYACAKTFPNANGHQTTFCIATMVIVLVTTFFFGGTTEIALDILNIDVDVDEEDYIRDTGGKRAGIVQTFEERYIFPCVIRDYGNLTAPEVGDDLYLQAADGMDGALPKDVMINQSAGSERGIASSATTAREALMSLKKQLVQQNGFTQRINRGRYNEGSSNNNDVSSVAC